MMTVELAEALLRRDTPLFPVLHYKSCQVSGANNTGHGSGKRLSRECPLWDDSIVVKSHSQRRSGHCAGFDRAVETAGAGLGD
jgi:hypothetical protein